MNKTTLAVLASALLISAFSSNAMSDAGHTHVHLGSSGSPVMSGNGCLHTGNSGASDFAECGAAEMAQKPVEMVKPAPQPQPKVITKVIVDCSKCK